MSEDQIHEEQHADMTAQEQYEMLMQHLQSTINPLEFMAPSQREIAMLTLEELESEYQLVQAKTSPRSRAQRDMIVNRYEFEQQREPISYEPNKIISDGDTDAGDQS